MTETIETPTAAASTPAPTKKVRTKAKARGTDSHPPGGSDKGSTKHKGQEGATNKAQEGEPKRVRVTIEGDNGPITIPVPPGAKDFKELRATSKRGKLLEKLKSDKGMTMGQMAAMFEWERRDCADALRLLAKHQGIATHRDEHNHWRVASRKEANAAAK